MQEIERKFLIKPKDFKLLIKTHSPLSIWQGYLTLGKQIHTRVRIIFHEGRMQGFLTTKIGKGLVREEMEEEISLPHAKALLSQCKKVLFKYRLHVRHEQHLWDIDYYPRFNLCVGEIELKNLHEPFNKPLWVGKEISHIKKYGNTQLARRPGRGHKLPPLDR